MLVDLIKKCFFWSVVGSILFSFCILMQYYFLSPEMKEKSIHFLYPTLHLQLFTFNFLLVSLNLIFPIVSGKPSEYELRTSHKIVLILAPILLFMIIFALKDSFDTGISKFLSEIL